MAQEEPDPKRKKELEIIAENCERVPAKPARTYWEALQTIWWVIVGCWIDGGPISITPGRMNTYLYQFYKRDKDEGKITQEEAIELMECFFLKILEGGLFVWADVHESIPNFLGGEAYPRHGFLQPISMPVDYREGLIKLLALIKTYMDLGGSHIQFNCVSGETLRDAQRHPEKYRDLVVRVAGFSAFFIHLDKEVQEEVIKRTELRFD